MKGGDSDNPDFVALIDGVIDRQVREELTKFLWRYEHEGGGEFRKLRPSEVRLIRSAIDGFLADRSVAKLGMAEFQHLEERLSAFAAAEQDFVGEDALRIRNACFDAMVCIKALEARLAKEFDANMEEREGRATNLSS